MRINSRLAAMKILTSHSIFIPLLLILLSQLSICYISIQRYKLISPFHLLSNSVDSIELIVTLSPFFKPSSAALPERNSITWSIRVLGP